MIILGIDPGTLVTGYALIKVDKFALALIDFGCIKPPPKDPLFDRYLILHNAICELMHLHTPQAIAIEAPFVHKNVQSTLKLGMAKGVIIVAAKKNGPSLLEIHEYSPKEAKLAVTGNGNASKPQVQTMLKHIFKLSTPPGPEDASDAISIAVCHAHAMNSSHHIKKALHSKKK